MKVAFKEIRFHRESMLMINRCNKVIEAYQAQGLRLTLRQLYYQFVSHNLFPESHKWLRNANGKWVKNPAGTINAEPNYSWLSAIVSNGRLAGYVDWDAIEDRTRKPVYPGEFRDLRQLVESAISCYRLPRWKGQKFYAELWVEKDALAGVLEPLARQFHVTMMVNRGYSSQSAMFESAKRFMVSHENQEPILFYLGDHDPSGEDMVRDIEDRLLMFGVSDIRVEKLALTMDQIVKYNPPPNPAKMKDPRAKGYVDIHGDSSWEVDALPPEVLAEIIHEAFSATIDQDKMDVIIKQEEKDKKKMRRIYER
jgi:hypothetical protein